MPRILLIDDDASLLDALSIAFEDAGHEVLAAPDGVRGLARIQTDRPDAVVSGVNIPGLDGLSLCRRLRESGDGVPVASSETTPENPRVIAATGAARSRRSSPLHTTHCFDCMASSALAIAGERGSGAITRAVARWRDTFLTR